MKGIAMVWNPNTIRVWRTLTSAWVSLIQWKLCICHELESKMYVVRSRLNALLVERVDADPPF